jgi:ribonuclease HI
MAKKKKYYVVWEGNNPGIYDTWEECQLQVKGFPNARFKSYPTKAEAEEGYAGVYEAPARKKKPRNISSAPKTGIEWDSISVDAACSGNPGLMEYRGVETQNKNELFHIGPLQEGTNNVGEFLALVHALAMLSKQGDSKTPVYSDSKIAIGWVKRKKANTKLKRTRRNTKLFNLISRAERWLKDNPYKTRILKWETKRWGEIPADFGRK